MIDGGRASASGQAWRRGMRCGRRGWRPPVPPAAPAPDPVQWLLGNGTRAVWVTGDLSAGRAWFQDAWAAARGTGGAAALADAALGLGGLRAGERRGADADQVLARQRLALAGLDPDSLAALRLRVRLAAEADHRAGRHEAIVAEAALARRHGDPVAWAEAASLAYQCLLGPEHTQARYGLAQELIELGDRTGRPGDLLLGLLWRVVDRYLDGAANAGRALAELRGRLDQDDHLAVGYLVAAIEVMLSIRAGRFEPAQALAAACARRGAAAGDPDATGWFGLQTLAIRWYQGRVGELVPMLDELVDSPSIAAADHWPLAALALATASAGDHGRAAGALARLGAAASTVDGRGAAASTVDGRGTGLAELPRGGTWLVTLYAVVETAYLLDDRSTAQAAYELLLPYARLPMLGALAATCFGSVRYALGVASLTGGDVHQSVAHLRAAVQDNLALGHWPAATLARARLAEALALRGEPGDQAESAQESDIALRQAGGLGMALPPARTRPEPAGPGAARPDPRPARCQRRGRQWEVELGYRAVAVDNSVGMRYLAVLLANPGHEIPAIELAAGPGSSAVAAAGTAPVSAQPVLDEVAKRQYRQRLAQLQADLDRYEARGDAHGARRVLAERDWLLAELSAAAGLGGRSRPFAGTEERARVAVGKAIRRALDRIAAADAAIGRELRACVHTGLRCSYRPL